MKDPILFDFMGLHLQEPMAFIFNMAIAVYCFAAYKRLQNGPLDPATVNWKMFYLTFGVSTVFGAFGHIFFQYLGVAGKIPCWTLGGLANVFAARAMMQYNGFSSLSRGVDTAIWLKSGALLIVAVTTQNFLFIAIDAILTYVIFTGIYGFMLYKKGLNEMRYMVTGVLVLLPSAFFFILRLNPHRWFNAHDVSHLLMLACIACFYTGIKKWGVRQTVMIENV
jgi:hypothetical protein